MFRTATSNISAATDKNALHHNKMTNNSNNNIMTACQNDENNKSGINNKYKNKKGGNKTTTTKYLSIVLVLCLCVGTYMIHKVGTARNLSRQGFGSFSFTIIKNNNKSSYYYTNPHFQQLSTTTTKATKTTNERKSKKNINSSPPMISWSMYPIADNKKTYQELYVGKYTCRVDDEYRLDIKDETLKSKVHFRTDITTNLNILVMGDSVAMQIGELLQEAIGVSASQRLLLRPLYPECVGPKPDIDCSSTDGKHESLFWGRSSSDYGGGGAGGWRIVNWWLKKLEGKPLPEAFDGGWTKQDTKTLLKTIQNFAPAGLYSKNNKPKIDVLVFRVSQPWMDWNEMTPSMMHKTIQVAREQLNVNTVIFVTIPFANNIVDKHDIEQMHFKNEMIREFARSYTSSSKRLDDMTVLTWDLAQLNNALVQENAKEMGYQITDSRDFDFALNILKPKRAHVSHTHSIGHVCGGPKVKHNSKDCVYNNMITYDGQHLCLQTFGGRMMAGLACVIRCATTYGSNAEEENPSKLHECEDACNDQYMSLNEISESLFAEF